MRYVEVIDLQGNKSVIDTYQRRYENRYIVDGHRFGFDTNSIFVIGDKKYGLLREFNCKDNTIEEKEIWFINYFDLDDENKVSNLVLENECLLACFAKEYKSNYDGYHAEVKY